MEQRCWSSLIVSVTNLHVSRYKFLTRISEHAQVSVHMIYHETPNPLLGARIYPKKNDQMCLGSSTFLGCHVSYDGLDNSDSGIEAHTSGRGMESQNLTSLSSLSREEIQKGLSDSLEHRYFKTGTDLESKSKKSRDNNVKGTMGVPNRGALIRSSVGHTGIQQEQDQVEAVELRAYRPTGLSNSGSSRGTSSGNSSRDHHRGVRRRSVAEARADVGRITAEFRCVCGTSVK